VADLDVTVIGAGPYGLSAGMHLKAAGLGVCVFGEPMDFWASKMPAGMLLRSPRVASNLSDPGDRFSLEAYEKEAGIAPQAPLPLETFVAYGRWFRKHLGEDHDTRWVRNVKRDGSQFRLQLQNGDTLTSRSVVVAAGIGDFRKLPVVFQNLGSDYASHCYQGVDVKAMSGKRVAVIGAGQSALECAALLHESGAKVEIIARQPMLKWIGQHKWLHQMGPLTSMLYAKHDVGPVGISRLVAYPRLCSHLPLSLRDKIRKRAVRPAGSRWLPDRLKDVKTSSGRYVKESALVQGEVALKLDDGSTRVVDHVLCGTGYSVEVSKYKFLSEDILADIDQFDGYPKLGRGFATSVPGLHIIGAPAARTFGPLLYFVAGTEFASNELTPQLKKKGVLSASRLVSVAGRA
jgi:FAD-dependent urate hydroxylase